MIFQKLLSSVCPRLTTLSISISPLLAFLHTIPYNCVHFLKTHEGAIDEEAAFYRTCQYYLKTSERRKSAIGEETMPLKLGAVSRFLEERKEGGAAT